MKYQCFDSFVWPSCVFISLLLQPACTNILCYSLYLFNFVNCETNIFHRDAGKDPYWDFKRGRRKKIGEDGCADDGGYEDLFRRDQADEVEHGDELLAKSRRR